MGGPAVGLLVEHALTEDQWNEIDQWIRSIASAHVTYESGKGFWGEERPWHFDLTDGSCIGLPSLGGQEAFHVGLSIGHTPSPADWEQLYSVPAHWEELGFEQADLDEIHAQNQQARAALGYPPEQRISLYVLGPRQVEERVLGQLALLAERYHALIDLDDRLYRLRPNQRLEDVAEEDKDQYEQSLVLPGCLLHLFGSTVVDADCLGGWLQHPDFYLNK